MNNNHFEQDKQIGISSFLQKEYGIYHHTYEEELLQYEYVRKGDMRSVKENERFFSAGITGRLSLDELRNKRYLFVVATTLATRFAIEGGLESQYAYIISDSYIQKMDTLSTIDEITALQSEMISYFTAEVVKNNETSHSKADALIPISKATYRAMDYIYYHLHEKILLKDIAEDVGLSPNYLNSLFKKEKGITIQEYITTKRIEAAKNMLIYSDFSETEISEFLAFSSVSHFIKVFRDKTGLTPSLYQKEHFRTHLKWKC